MNVSGAPFAATARTFAENELQRFRDENNSKLTRRYALLLSYLRDRIERYWDS